MTITQDHPQELSVPETHVLVLVGSLRADSLNRRLAEALRAHAPAGVHLQIAEGLGEIPFYNEDLDGDAAPPAVRRIREQVASADRVLVITPEYNGTFPAVLGNVLDWVSRPRGTGALAGTPLAVVGTSVGRYGGTWAHEAARRSASVAGAVVVEDVSLSHRYQWGQDPAADAATVQLFVDAVQTLVGYQPAAA